MEELTSLTAEELDIYLANGWFRMNQTIFTTHIEWWNNSVCSVIWLRVRLKDFDVDRRYKKLSQRNEHLIWEIVPAIITDEHEALFSLYKTSKSFQASSSLHYLIFADKDTNVFNTWMINLYDHDTLIGAGFFDIGKNSAAGISSFYHPAYSKNSLGLFIIYQKMFFCKSKGIAFFYPGYFSPDYSAFDYKLTIGESSLEYFSPAEGAWFSFYENGK